MATTNVPRVYMILRHEGKVLCVLREHTGFMDGNYALPSGHVEDDETFREAACRETLEEVGLIVSPNNLRHLCTMHRRSANDVRVDVLFEADRWQGEPVNGEPEKYGEVTWLTLDSLPENFLDYQRAMLEAATTGVTYLEFGWAR